MTDNTRVRIAACRRCGADFEKRTCALFCSPCRPLNERERVTAYHKAHPELVRAIKTKWRLANPDKQAVAAERWRLANMERTRVYRRAAKKRNPIANRSYVRVRKVRKRQQTVVPFTPQQLASRLAVYGGLCWMCGKPAGTIDHVKPISKGGAHMLANLRPACLSCNSRKGERWPLAAA